MFKKHDEVCSWAESKGIFDKSNPVKQCEKFIEEAGELQVEILAVSMDKSSNNLAAAKMEFGDVLVTLILLSEMSGFDMNECLSMAYNKINKRNGRMVNGFFVKD